MAFCGSTYRGPDDAINIEKSVAFISRYFINFSLSIRWSQSMSVNSIRAAGRVLNSSSLPGQSRKIF